MKFGKVLRSADCYYKKAMTVPANTSADSDSYRNGVGGQQGQLQAVVEVLEEVSLAQAATLSVALQDSENDTDFTTVATTTHTGATGGSTFGVGSTLARFGLTTNLREYTRLKITTTDAAAAGKIDCFVDFVSVLRQ